jgi:glyoxylase-like metal-dependent hydrolase (beta-lactamase superfamily II)
LNYDAAAGHTSTRSADAIIARIKKDGLKLQWILETHVHADHLSAAPHIQEKLGGKLSIGEKIRVVQDTFGKIFNAGTEFQRDGSRFDHLFKDGDVFQIGSLNARVMHTPGHTPPCITFIIGDVAFVGDTLFMPDYGTARADSPGGDARQLYRSIHKVMALPPRTRLFLCHDYRPPGRDKYVWETTVAAERDGNVHAHVGISEDEFVAMRTARDATLGAPKLIIPSIQVNMNAGHFPKADKDGNVFFKVPVNRL